MPLHKSELISAIPELERFVNMQLKEEGCAGSVDWSISSFGFQSIVAKAKESGIIIPDPMERFDIYSETLEPAPQQILFERDMPQGIRFVNNDRPYARALAAAYNRMEIIQYSLSEPTQHCDQKQITAKVLVRGREQPEGRSIQPFATRTTFIADKLDRDGAEELLKANFDFVKKEMEERFYAELQTRYGLHRKSA